MANGKQQNSEIDSALADWRQGDCAKPDIAFVFRIDRSHPITKEAQRASGESEDDLVDVDVAGFMVVSHTCDIARSCDRRPFLLVAPLIAVDDPVVIAEIEIARRPQYAFVPGVASDKLVADLDRIMTVEKSVVAGWRRIAGCTTDRDSRRLREAIARKYQRTPFPDDFQAVVNPLMERLRRKHGKDSPEGDALRSLTEIRVHASPDWYARTIDLYFWFIRETEVLPFDGRDWASWSSEWLSRMQSSGRYVSVSGGVATFKDLTAEDYICSDRLDLDHLSG